MNVIELLAKSAESNHGREFEPTQIKEIVTILQGMQYQIANDQGRLDALTRILAVSLNQLGGALDIAAETFADAEHYIVDANWDHEEEGSIVHVSIRPSKVEVPELSEDSGAAEESLDSQLSMFESEGGRALDNDEDDSDEA